MSESCAVQFCTFELDLSTHELRSNGRRVSLQSQPDQVLALLLAAKARRTRPGAHSQVLADDGKLDDALAVADRALTQDPASVWLPGTRPSFCFLPAATTTASPPPGVGLEGYRRRRLQDMLKEPHVPTYSVASAYARLGDHDRALTGEALCGTWRVDSMSEGTASSIWSRALHV